MLISIFSQGLPYDIYLYDLSFKILNYSSNMIKASFEVEIEQGIPRTKAETQSHNYV